MVAACPSVCLWCGCQSIHLVWAVGVAPLVPARLPQHLAAALHALCCTACTGHPVAAALGTQAVLGPLTPLLHSASLLARSCPTACVLLRSASFAAGVLAAAVQLRRLLLASLCKELAHQGVFACLLVDSSLVVSQLLCVCCFVCCSPQAAVLWQCPGQFVYLVIRPV